MTPRRLRALLLVVTVLIMLSVPTWVIAWWVRGCFALAVVMVVAGVSAANIGRAPKLRKGAAVSMKPPSQSLIESMGREPTDVLGSIACLAAAVAVQRKDTLKDVTAIGGREFTAEERAHLLTVIEKARRMFLSDTPEQLAYAIALYRAHLKWCGYDVESGTTH